MKITYFGTTMLLLDDGTDQILLDCHVSRPSLINCFLGKLETDTVVAERVISEYHINRLKAIFISHAHYDHVLDAPFFARECQSHIYASTSALQIARGNGVSEEYLHDYAKSMEWQAGNFHVKIIPSIHSVAHWYNNDLGQCIGAPLKLPASKKRFKEGGSFDFLVTHNNIRFLVRPSYNYLPGQLDNIQADVLYLGIGGMGKDNLKRQQSFMEETIGKVQPNTVIPFHWDNFFSPLYEKKDSYTMPGWMDNIPKAMNLLENYCDMHGIRWIVQQPLSEIDWQE